MCVSFYLLMNHTQQYIPAALNFTLLSFYSLNNHEKIFIIDMYVKVNNNPQHEKFIMIS